LPYTILRKEVKMISQEKLDTLFQIVNSMEQGVSNAEKSFVAGNSENLESAKREILELQKKLSEELKLASKG
jgi:hypothetical protein